MSALETRTFRAESLEEALGAVRRQLGPEAIVVRQREGIVGGIGGFFGKRCVEIDVECPPAAPQPRTVPPSAVPPRAVGNAYAAVDTVAEEDGDDDPGDLFRNLLSDSSLFASALAEAIEHEPDAADDGDDGHDDAIAFEPLEPQPLQPQPVQPQRLQSEPLQPEPFVEAIPEREPEPLPLPLAPPPPAIEGVSTVPSTRATDLLRVDDPSLPPTLLLTRAGIDPRTAETVVEDVYTQLRIFDPDGPILDQVRRALAARIATRALNGRFRRRVIALVGPHEGGKTSAAARLVRAHVAAAHRVTVLSLEPVRSALELGVLTGDLDVELITADHPGLIDFALPALERAEVVIVDTPGVSSGDKEGWARLAMLLRPLGVGETHLVLPGSLLPAGVDACLGAAEHAGLKVNRLLLTQLDRKPGVGPAVSAAIRTNIPIAATFDGTRLRPADAHELAAAVLSLP